MIIIIIIINIYIEIGYIIKYQGILLLFYLRVIYLFITFVYKYDMILVIIYVTQCLACIDWYIYILSITFVRIN